MSVFGLDYDRTYTADPILWDEFVASAQRRGHRVLCVTMRRPDEAITMPCPVVYTSRRAKVPFVEGEGITVDVWIDDSPHWLLSDG